MSTAYLLKPSERLYLIDHYKYYYRAHILHITSERDNLTIHGSTYFEGSKQALDATIDAMKYMEDQWRLELEWVQRLRDAELAQ